MRYLVLLLVITVIIIYVTVYYNCIKKTVEKYDEKIDILIDKIQEHFIKTIKRPIDIVHTRYYKIITQNMELPKAVQIVQEDLLLYNKKVEKGREYTSNSTIVIAGLLQNGFYLIPQLKERCLQIISKFRDYRIIILENNSSDNSRKQLLEWTIEDNNVSILCQDAYSINAEECDIFSNIQNDHSPMPNRIQRMSYLRNIYMEHIQHYYKEFDYLCVMDFDLEGELYIDGLLQSVYLLKDEKYDGVTCNGMLLRGDEGNDFVYYDSFAHVELNETELITDMAAKSKHDYYVHTNMTHLYSSQMIPDRVRSAFGGLAIYNMKAVIYHRYNYSQTFLTCEHTFFHDKLKLIVNPRLIFLITNNG